MRNHLPKSRVLAALLLAMGVLVAIGPAQAAPSGWLDPSFGHAGIVTTHIGDYGGQYATGANSLAIQADGKIVAAGSALHFTTADFALARYRRDGSLDPRFGERGIVTTDFGPDPADPSSAQGVALQPDGKIVVAGFGWNGKSY